MKLTDTQLVILSAAAAREGRMVLPLPPSVALDHPGTWKVLQRLLGRGLVQEIEIPIEAPAWRAGVDDRPLGLAITSAGLDAIGLGEAADGTEVPPKAAPQAQPRRTRGTTARKRKLTAVTTADTTTGSSGRVKKRKTKAATVLVLLRHKSGVTVNQLMAATGWQAHSVRGFLSGTVKTRLGLELASRKPENGERRYRIEGGRGQP